MIKNINDNNNDNYVRQVRAIGESLIKNAESIVGSEKYLKSVSISATIGPLDELASICIDREFLPEKIFEEHAID